MANDPAHFCFLDLETTGLDPVQCKILEVAAIVTNRDLCPLSHFSSVVRPLGDTVQMLMPPNLIKMHRDSGLLQEIAQKSEEYAAIGLEDVQKALVEFLRQYPSMILAGFSVHFDKEFLRFHMPVVLGLFGYKIMDVSAIKIAARLWRPDVPESHPDQVSKHRALDDCREAIRSLQHYGRHLFQLPG